MQQVRTLRNAHMYFSDRNDGVSVIPYDSLNIGQHVGDNETEVIKNREILQGLIAEQVQVVDQGDWIFLNQTHEPNIFHAGEEVYDPQNLPIADACITQTKNLPLVVMTADCGPLVISGENILAVVHASWKTIVAGLIEKTIDEMRELTKEQKLSSFLGPCIYPHTYEFETTLANELSDKLGPHVIGETREGKTAFNLPAAIKAKCEASSVEFDQMGINTYLSPNHFSYRRDNVTGRQGVVAWLK